MKSQSVSNAGGSRIKSRGNRQKQSIFKIKDKRYRANPRNILSRIKNVNNINTDLTFFN